MDDKTRGGVVITPGAWYDLDWLKRNFGGVAAIRSARRRGLKIYRNGRRSWCAGDDIIAHLKGTSTPVS